MADTVIKLIENIQNEFRLHQRKNFLDFSIIDSKINLISNNIDNLYKKGIPYEDFIKIFNNEIINCILYDFVVYDFIIINIGKKTLYSMLNNIDIKSLKNCKYANIQISNIKPHILNMISVIYKNNDVIILLEISDNEGRIVVKPKNLQINDRPSIKFINFPLYNYIILDPK